MVKLVITGKSIDEVKRQLLDAAAEMTGRPFDQPPRVEFAAPTSQAAVAHSIRDTVDTPMPTLPASDVTPPSTVPMPEPRIYTQPEVVQAISAVLSRYGMDHARQILAEFEANKIGELNSLHFGAFIARCEQVVAQ